MKFKRLLTVGITALLCAGTATAASQLNSVQVTPKANATIVSLRTTGSYAHKEYRPDEHLAMVDLTGVTVDPAVVRLVASNSALLKSYKVSSYTGASGIEVTRIELVLGDNVTVDVKDDSDGMKVLLSNSGATSTTSPSVPSVVVPVSPSQASSSATASKTAPASSPKALSPVPGYAVPVAKNVGAQQSATSVRPSRSVEHAKEDNAEAEKGALIPTTIRGISVQRGKDTLDVVIDGPSSAHSFLLKNPDRLVLDFSNAIPQHSVKNISVRTKDVLQVRVSRFQAAPPVTRVVIDLSGPRAFEVVNSAKQVVVRVKAEEVGMLAPPRKAAPAPELASAEAPPAVGRVASVNQTGASHAALVTASQDSKKPEITSVLNANAVSNAPVAATSAPVVATSAPAVASASVVATSAPMVSKEPAVSEPLPAAAIASQLHDQAPVEPKPRATVAAEKMAAMEQPKIEMARLSPPTQDSFAGNPPPAIRETGKFTGEPISVNLKDVDLKDFFRLIHEISGLNVVLDPNVKGTLTLVLDDVPWDQALDIVLKNNALDREVQGNVLRIAALDTLRKEAVDRRAQSEAVALAVDRQTITRFLSYSKSKDVVPTIKKFLTARGDVISDDRTNALIISDIPSVLPNLDRLISQLDRKSQEVEIEVRVVSATRSFSRDLGVQLGFNWGNGVSTIGGLSSLTTSSSTSSSGTTTTTNTNPGTIPLFSNYPATNPTSGFSISNITKTYGIDAVLTAAENHNLAKVLSRPHVVTQSNVKAEVKQGVKIPVYTASTGNANASVTYVDAVLRLSVTPQITSDNTIFLTVDVENTQPSGTINSNYILTTQQASTQVLVTDGGTVAIGGVIQTTNTVSTSQTPVLGNIPWLGNLFKERSVKTETDELIFFITPKIIQT